MKAPVIQLKSALVGYGHREGACPIMSPINVSVKEGEFICLIGENGKGKSTVLKSISGEIPYLSGEVLINGKLLPSISASELAEQMSLVLTDRIQIGMITVGELVAFGRYPFTNWLAKMTPLDLQIVHDAMESCGVLNLKDRYYSNLSDGEKQKVAIARALAQQTPLILLDEPLNHLDLINKAEIFSLLKRLCVDFKKTIVISTHQVELALQAADKIWLINGKHQLIETTPEAAIENHLFEEAFISDKVKFDPLTKTFQLKAI
ncbi:ABC transporter ATP-binding protein [bacterium]|nr:ABC transporter ATP-binding protein [bacterium]